MIKVESQLLKDKKIVAFRFESSRQEDLADLDLLVGCFESVPNVKAAFLTSNVALIHIKGLPDSLFEPDSNSTSL